LLEDLGISEKHDRRNEEITAPRLRVIGADGAQLGIITRYEAMDKALEAGLDLVEISPNADPPVAKIMDYGKYLYQKDKQHAQARKKQKQIQVKEVKFRPGTDAGDYQIKLRKINEFLEEGDKVKVTLRFRGRELAHPELGMALIDRIRNELAAITVVEQFPRLEGKMMVMVLAPKK
jgi:translation initiation factor IF-3